MNAPTVWEAVPTSAAWGATMVNVASVLARPDVMVLTTTDLPEMSWTLPSGYVNLMPMAGCG